MSDHDTVIRALVSNMNRELGALALFRILLAHRPWFATDLDTELPRFSCDPTAGSHVIELGELLLQRDKLRAIRIGGEGLTNIMTEDAVFAAREMARSVQTEKELGDLDVDALRNAPFTIAFEPNVSYIHMMSPIGPCIAAFTAADAVQACREAVGSDLPSTVVWTLTSGDHLFGRLSQLAAGLVINPYGPRRSLFDRAACLELFACTSAARGVR